MLKAIASQNSKYRGKKKRYRQSKTRNKQNHTFLNSRKEIFLNNYTNVEFLYIFLNEKTYKKEFDHLKKEEEYQNNLKTINKNKANEKYL